jgi:hypothetical protein
MGRLDHAALRTPNAGKLWMLPQHPDAHGLMPYEMAEIEECSNSLEQALRNGQEVNLAAQCAWYPSEVSARV